MRIPKTVKGYSTKLDTAASSTMEEMMTRVLTPKQTFQEQFSGIRSMVLVKSFRKVRDIARSRQKDACGGKTYSEAWGIPERFWVRALKDACTEINSLWSNLANLLKEKLRDYDHLTEDEKSYCRYVFSARPLWQKVLLYEDMSSVRTKNYRKLRGAVAENRLEPLHQMIRRMTRKYKPSKPHSKEVRCISFDSQMYEISTGPAGSHIQLMSCDKGNRLRLELTGPWKYKKTGDIQVIYDRKKHRVEIHKLIQAKTKEKDGSGGEKGTDKGMATLLSCSSGKEYGEGFGRILAEEAERLDKRNTNRNYFIQQKKDFLNEVAKVRNDKNLDHGTKRFREETIMRQVRHLEEYNLGNNLYHRQHEKAKAELSKHINASVLQMVKEEKPSLIVKEDLSFTRDKQPEYRKTVMRRLSMWMKGELDDRITYICQANGIPTEDVNPAYTSQYCPVCGAKTARSGIHHEVMTCPDCGKMNANTAAAINILKRKGVSEITKYTPYKEVKKILDARYLAKQR